jgi:hypothetical protein
MPDGAEAEVSAVARLLAQLDGKFIGASEWQTRLRAEYEDRARRVLQTIENVRAGNRSGGLPR